MLFAPLRHDHQRDVSVDAVLNGSGEIVKGRHGTLRRSCDAGHLD